MSGPSHCADTGRAATPRPAAARHNRPALPGCRPCPAPSRRTTAFMRSAFGLPPRQDVLRIGADFGEWDRGAGAGTVLGMAARRSVPAKICLAASRQLGIDRLAGKRRRFELGDERFEPFVALLESGRSAATRCRSPRSRRRHKGSSLRLPNAAGRPSRLPQPPHRGEIRVADRIVPRRLGQDEFRQVERVVASRAPGRLARSIQPSSCSASRSAARVFGMSTSE